MNKITPDQVATVTDCTIRGLATRETAQVAGISHTTVCRTINKPDVRARIEKEATEIINRGLRPARQVLTRIVAEGNTKGADHQTKKLSLDAAKHITNIAGLSGNAPGTIINQLIQINQDPEQTKELSDIKAFLSNQWTDAEVVE